MRLGCFMNKKLVVILLSGLMFLSSASVVVAANPDCPTEDVSILGKTVKQLKGIEVKVSIPIVTEGPCLYEGRNVYYVKDLTAFAAALYKFLVGVVGIAAVITMMFGGYMWLFAGGNSSKVGEAKSILGSAVLGLFLAIGSFMILNLINPDLVNWKFSADRIDEITEISSVGKVKSFCNSTARKNAMGEAKKNGMNPLDFRCGSIYYNKYDEIQKEIQISCAKGKENNDACKAAKDKMNSIGCMDVTCPMDQVCTIETKNDYYIGGICAKTLNAVNKATGISESVSVKSLNKYCGIAAIEGSINRLSSTCQNNETMSYPEFNDIKLNTCTIVSEQGKGYVYKPIADSSTWRGWAITVIGALGNATGTIYGLNSKGEITSLTSPSCHDLKSLAGPK